MAQEKGLAFEVVVNDDLPDQIVTDRKRLDQILRNLVANALKFTERGSINVTFTRPAPGIALSSTGGAAVDTLAIAVKDTGIGIPADKHQQIVATFEQGDGTTIRQYGSTGLGLTISRELATLLGGEIQVESTPGRGATFTLYIPCRPPGGLSAPAAQAVPASRSEHRAGRPYGPVSASRPFIPDDRDRLAESDWTILVIEDDPSFGAISVAKCHENGLKCIATPSGEAGLELVARYRPKGVILDIRLPARDGINVLSALKEDLRTHHIPVHVVSVEGHLTESLSRGAIGRAVKPLDQESLAAVSTKFRGCRRRRATIRTLGTSARFRTITTRATTRWLWMRRSRSACSCPPTTSSATVSSGRCTWSSAATC
jgi:CheY-like chemotaxis protein